ncbi:hypothetical protein FHS19_005713 [Paenibacillus rhizosphaerae]|uniref:Aminoglycoside phosphotransferase n=1 Tax=Paenibacillus rhizosphaerae TaxID=297318 RepID=A0A839TWW6_9BACL|nr:hypothetical protein [Paenibacillus rhizosphaerae]MBB3130993.1 hypothetical protein [Paenibacillus rhizosphaerae]
MLLSEEILKSFGLQGEALPLEGGQNTTVKVQDAVLKPSENVRHAEWVLGIMHDLQPRGYRISRPIHARNGSFVSDGWTCSRFEPGREVQGHLEQKLKVARLYHRDLAAIPYDGFPEPDHPWSHGHRIAWQTEGLPAGSPDPVKDFLAGLLGKVKRSGEYTVQLIHADLAGNILFDEALGPLIIDFSPTVAPEAYAEAILVCDGIAWQGCPLSDLGLLPDDGHYREMLLRAVIFRLSVSAIFCGEDTERFFTEAEAFGPIIEHLALNPY